MKEAIGQIHPDLIHLNTVVRPPSESWATPLNEREMEEHKGFFGERALIISEFDRHLLCPERNLKEEIIGILKRRPLSLEDLAKWTGIPKEEVEDCVNSLKREGRIRKSLLRNSTYLEISDST
jgi:wyosine [tRNA(Phe)-imidazoG37] synthetase (radical SAM superfamily)